jgi:hypothetical protein
MEEERDVVTFADDEGNEFELDVIDYFEYEGEDYAVLVDLSAEDECGDDECECEHEQDVYIMKIVQNGDMEEFLPADEDKMDILASIVEQRMSENHECDEDCECDDCGDDDDGCDCKH